MNPSELLNQILHNTIQADIETIKDTSSKEDIAGWDSFAGLMLVAELEKEFDVQFTTQEVEEMKTIGSIKEALKKHSIIL